MRFAATLGSPRSPLSRSTLAAARVCSPACVMGMPKVVVIAGPTAVGKSALAMRLAELLPGEIISVDSVQVYRGLDVGSNKPSLAEQSRVPHHLLDICEPSEEYTAGDFYRDALRTIREVLSRGRTPVLVGGTSMYLRWLIQGRPTAPKADPAISQAANARLEPFQQACIYIYTRVCVS